MKHDNKTTSAIALGFFDGVHRGHGALLERIADLSATALPTALTFDRHPATFLGKQSTPQLSTLLDRQWMLQHYYDIKQVVVADFSAIMTMEWEDFIEEYLQKTLHVVSVVAGHDFHFGRGGEGNPQKLQSTCKQLGITCEIISPVTQDDILISSTYIRKLIQDGEMGLAVGLLGHPHILTNQVKHGNKIGRSALGFPTVNLEIPDSIIIPKFGVYACRIWVEGVPYLAVTNVGVRPTITEHNLHNVTVEGFLLDFPDQELYGSTLRMEFYHYIRGEQKFPNLQALTAQIARDVETTVCFFRGIEML